MRELNTTSTVNFQPQKLKKIIEKRMKKGMNRTIGLKIKKKEFCFIFDHSFFCGLKIKMLYITQIKLVCMNDFYNELENDIYKEFYYEFYKDICNEFYKEFKVKIQKE